MSICQYVKDEFEIVYETACMNEMMTVTYDELEPGYCPWCGKQIEVIDKDG